MVRFVVIRKQRLGAWDFGRENVGNEGGWDIRTHKKMGPRVRDDFSYLGFRVGFSLYGPEGPKRLPYHGSKDSNKTSTTPQAGGASWPRLELGHALGTNFHT